MSVVDDLVAFSSEYENKKDLFSEQNTSIAHNHNITLPAEIWKH